MMTVCYPPSRRFIRHRCREATGVGRYPPSRRFRRHVGERQLFDHVIRRVGGLEGPPTLDEAKAAVIRRVGGLEVRGRGRDFHDLVIRRVGGLEGAVADVPAGVGVIRRVGGLEVTVGAFLRLPLTCTRLYGERGVGGGHGPGAWWMGCSSGRGNTARAVTRARGKAGSRRRS